MGRDDSGGVAGLADESGELRLRVGEGPHDRRQVAEQLGQGVERAVDRRAAAGERGAEVVEVALDVLARRRVEDREEVVELGADGVRAHADRLAVRQRPRRAAAHEVDVLQAERRARADLDRRVGGDRRRGRVEVQRELRRPARARHGRDARDLADPEAALADLVADHEACRVRHVDADLLDRDEGQSAVGLVGEQHRGDEHEHRDGPDEDRIRRDGTLTPHGPRR